MRRSLASRVCVFTVMVLAAMLVGPFGTPAGGISPARAQTGEIAVPEPKPAHRPDLATRIKQYRLKLKAYDKARAVHETRSAPYWRTITGKRKLRVRKRAKRRGVSLNDYVLEQPPLYDGPPKPIDPEAKPGAGRGIPVVADFVHNARKHFGFVPERPAREVDFKRAYARAAAAAGFAKRTCVKIYSFEAGGNGTYDVQAGLEYDAPADAQAISTALGYNQLLTANTIGLVAQLGDKILKALRAKAAAAGPERRAELQEKIAVFAKILRFTRSVKEDWYVHVRLGKTEKGLGVHALNLDIDIGPMLQVHKLLDSVRFAKRYGQTKPLQAAELEMMNLTGDGNGIDMVLMSQAMREKIPTANFFQQRGYERNSVATRNNTVAQLIAATDAKMEKEAQLPGARELATAFDAVARRGE
jgi:hypothetical protein